jgi:dTDP-4-dehydrorhamnose reductase
MAFKTITILGGKGMLGTDLATVASQRGLGINIYDLPEFDITDAQQVETVVSKSQVIVNCAAYTNVEKAESQTELANQINGYAVGRLGQIAKNAGVPVLHISTDFVFDGTKAEPYVETDATGPVNAYGCSKLLGETLLAESGCAHCTVRLEWSYGKHGVNFITKILNAAKQRDLLKVVDDQIGSPTCTVEVAKVILDLLQMKTFPTGLYHCAARGTASRYDMTRFLFDTLGVQTKIEPCKTADFKSAAQRPLNSRFNCTKLETLLGRSIPTWQEMLKNYLETR